MKEISQYKQSLFQGQANYQISKEVGRIVNPFKYGMGHASESVIALSIVSHVIVHGLHRTVGGGKVQPCKVKASVEIYPKTVHHLQNISDDHHRGTSK